MTDRYRLLNVAKELKQNEIESSDEKSKIDDAVLKGLEFFNTAAYCQTMLCKAWLEASDKLVKKMKVLDNEHGNSADIKSLYIDTFEETFTSLFRSPEYAIGISRMVNSMVECANTNRELFLDGLGKVLDSSSNKEDE